MKTHYSIHVSDGSIEGAACIEITPGQFNGQELSIQEREIIAQFTGNAMSVIFQLRERNEQAKRIREAADDAAKRERNQDSDAVSDVSLTPEGGGKIGIC